MRERDSWKDERRGVTPTNHWQIAVYDGSVTADNPWSQALG